MRGALIGLLIGCVVGAGAMYLVLRPPWAGRATPAHDAGVVAAALDGGVAKTKKTRRRPAGSVGQPDPDEFDETEPPRLTETDRKLEWRGDDVTLPTAKIDMGAGREARPLDDGEINGVIANQAAGVRDCVAQGATGTDLRATITVKIVVDGNGRVTRTKIQAPHYLFEHGLLACVQRATGRLRFAATGAPTLVTFPVNLG
ncbi:MAG: hypothetical protein WKG01_34380 [Kofleriaceae bacterium]